MAVLRTLFLVNVALLATAAVIPRVPQGTQFITGACATDADCASGCCGFKSGKCAGAVIAQERDGGCGFGDAAPNNNAAQKIQGANAEAAPGVPNAGNNAAAGSSAVAPAATSPAATSAAAAATGTQFITGACGSDADCASGCCNAQTALCAARLVALEGAGCGFNGTPVAASSAAAAPTSAAAAAPAASSSAVAAPAASSAAAPPAASSAAAAPAAAGTQFITGACASDADCASGCCGFKSGKCAGAVIAQERDGGCGFGDAAPNNNAAQQIQGPNAEAAPGVPKAGSNAAAATSAAAVPAAPAASSAASAAPAAASSAAAGTKFITSACASDAECASGCCGFKSGKCAGAVIAQERDGGCGFGDATPNNNAAQKIQGANAEKAPGVPRSMSDLE